ncbi:MAG: hypothetical protein V3V41_02625, partial [Candidatus Heimdallarchaeota archaeon]
MVLKTIERIRRTLPEVEHIVMFYNDGTVYQTTFEQFEESVNIPKVGEDLSKILSSFRGLYDLCNYKYKGYHQILFDTDDIDIIVIKLGEDTNLALFFRKTVEEGEIHIESIQKYITKIGKIIDIGRIDLVEQKIRTTEGALIKLYEQMEEKLEKQKEVHSLLGASMDEMKSIEKIEKEIEELTSSIKKCEIEKDQRIEEISKLEEKISSEEERKILVNKELKLKRVNLKELNKRLQEKKEKQEILENKDEEDRDEEKILEISKEVSELNDHILNAQQKVKDKEEELKYLKNKLEEDKNRTILVEEEKTIKEETIQDLY